MAFRETCVERATGLAAACGWRVLAQGGPEAVVGITVGAAGVAAELSGALRPRGPEYQAALRAIRRRIRSDMAAHAAVEGPDAEADLAEADAAMERALRGCFLDRASLAASARSREGFAQSATALILARLAEREPEVFGTGGPDLARRHAERVIRAALNAAIENEAYFRNLAPHLVLETLRGLGGLEERIGGLHDDLRATRGAVAQLQDRMQDMLDIVRRLGSPISTASEVDSVPVELIVNDRGESLILHDRPFPYPLDRVDYDPASGMIRFVIPGGFRKSFGVPVRPELARHLDHHTGRVLVVRADARSGEPIDGGYCPLRTI